MNHPSLVSLQLLVLVCASISITIDSLVPPKGVPPSKHKLTTDFERMPNLFDTRPARDSDIPSMAKIADQTLFPGDMLADMMAPFLGGTDTEQWHVVVTQQEDSVIGFAYVQAERLTDRTWNLRAIATDPTVHGRGAGTALISAVERALHGARLLVIDTTQTEDQARARRFYAARGYEQVAVIPAFFGEGEDKVTFTKLLPKS
mmetsp:Transcript_37327/g.57297  ORF Transcript_37327/g.57297 Transcript_37327/m.57297 type:complete len:203 (-) Transcript_37327:147-755(-)|eukprot:CAMPEP_0118707666 /NCGR_PEP_ID=MMETSP0800-20121206/21352_1 /TAXON_ID=210618 ORGANISM="Striatella unipunctata, Strain CCMP2910" /NCGR_SAMPLE_ID=MMETSP0800 /ASSEMBLY_ACC=CAM_ASM_000638 /LENGTH=202 /DNA_ID=CAMNT_0006610561 /DNA_START=59 /DNA_END=667 /DNA_ORIENTATION=+